MQEAIPDCDHIQISKYEWNGDIIPDVYHHSLHCLVQWLHRSSPNDRELSEDETKRLAQVIDEKCQDFAMEVKRKLHQLGQLSNILPQVVGRLNPGTDRGKLHPML
jgi:hypothetical protein